jgi:hypothetical protein
MKNKLKSINKGSKSAADSQPKTAHRAIVRPKSNPPCIALFPQGDTSVAEEVIDLSMAEYATLKRPAAPFGSGILMFLANLALTKIGAAPPNPGTDHPSCLCFYDAGVGELAGEIPLVGRELSSAVVAAYRQRISVDRFIADAIREKLAKLRGEESRPFKGGLTAVIQHPDGTEWTRVHFNASERRCIEAFLKSTGLALSDLFDKAVSSWAARLNDHRKAA